VIDNQHKSEALCRKTHRGSSAHFQQIKDIFEELNALNEINITEMEVRAFRQMRKKNTETQRLPPPVPRFFNPIKIEQSTGKTVVKPEPSSTITAPIELITLDSSDDEHVVVPEPVPAVPVAPGITPEMVEKIANLELDKHRYQLIIGIIIFVYALNLFTYFFIKYQRLYN